MYQDLRGEAVRVDVRCVRGGVYVFARPDATLWHARMNWKMRRWSVPLKAPFNSANALLTGFPGVLRLRVP